MVTLFQTLFLLALPTALFAGIAYHVSVRALERHLRSEQPSVLTAADQASAGRLLRHKPSVSVWLSAKNGIAFGQTLSEASMGYCATVRTLAWISLGSFLTSMASLLIAELLAGAA
jgi:hypothetical protein